MNTVPFLRPIVSYDLAVAAAGGTAVANDGASGRHGNFAANVRWVRLTALTVDVRINFNGTAVATSTLLPAGKPEVFCVTGSVQVSVIANTAATGTLNITEMSL